MERQKQIVLISPDWMMQHTLAEGLRQRGCQTLVATEYVAGLRLMYAAQPDLVLLDIGSAPEAGWETFERIRAMTDAPVILAVHRDETRHLTQSQPNTAILVKPVSVAQVAAQAQALGLLHPTAKPTDHYTLSSQRLKFADLMQIDRALSQVGEHGEVRLIIQQGRLRFMEKMVTAPLKTIA